MQNVWAYIGGPKNSGALNPAPYLTVEKHACPKCFHTKFGWSKSNRMGVGRFSNKIHNEHAHYHVTHI